VVLAAGNVSAQTVSVGAKVGAPLIDTFTSDSAFSGNTSLSFAKRYTVGPSFEFMLPSHIGFEAEALYKRSGYTRNLFLADAQTTFNNWEFPLLFKATLPRESFSVFGNTGITFRRVDGSTSFSNGTSVLTNQPLQLSEPWSHGYAAGGGVSMKFGPVWFEPELRYTRWASSASLNAPEFLANPNQLEYLLGIRFGK